MSRAYITEELRRLVYTRANGRCEYCLIHQDDTPITLPIDHIVAVKHGGAAEEDNLALSCLDCNLNKGTDLTTFDPLTNELVRLFNPREQQWDEHFILQSARIIGLTRTGRATVKLLQLNTPLRLTERQLLQATNRYPGR